MGQTRLWENWGRGNIQAAPEKGLAIQRLVAEVHVLPIVGRVCKVVFLPEVPLGVVHFKNLHLQLEDRFQF